MSSSPGLCLASSSRPALRHPSIRLVAALLLCALTAGAASSLRAETTAASGAQQITAIPCVITQPGTYYLAGDFVMNTSTGVAIEVGAAAVPIDLNGHIIANTVNPVAATGTLGVQCYTWNRCTVRNGTIKGFWGGVYLHGGPSAATPYGHLLENLSLCENTAVGVAIYASDTVVRNVRVLRILGQESGQYYAEAFQLNGPNNRVLSCDVGRMSSAGGNVAGIYFAYEPTGGCAIGNRISPDWAGPTSGITSSDPSVKFADNIVAAGVTTPYVGGTDAGNNN